MQIQRYLNGKPITRRALSHVELATGALKSAVCDARRRMEREAIMMSENQGNMAAEPNETGLSPDSAAMRTHG